MTTMRCLAGLLLAAACATGSWSMVPAADVSTRTYTVRWGDTLAGIAAHFYGDGSLYPRIAAANNLPSPHRIVAGATLLIPALTVVPQPAATETVPAPVPVAPVVASETPPAFVWRQEPNTVLRDREKLSFDVRWQFVKVGSASMEIAGVNDVNGRQAFHIVTTARSAPFFDTFYKVRDTNESWMDVQSLVSLKYATHISEAGKTRDETVLLDHENRRYTIVESSASGETSLWVQDVLSALYYLRTKDLAVGAQYTFDAHSSDKTWPLTVAVLRKERISVPAGSFDCFVVEPSLREGAGIFQAKGKLWVWLTADERRLPVLMRSKIAVGAIEAQLTAFVHE